MACNFESSNSESTSNESDYDTDEFNENAKVKKQKSETPKRKTSVAKKRVVSGKGKTLGKLKVFSICEEIESNIDTIERDAKVKILNEYAGDFVEMKNVLEREHFNAVFSQITKDFISNYKLKSVGSRSEEGGIKGNLNIIELIVKAITLTLTHSYRDPRDPQI